MTDVQLLRQYVAAGSHDAFAQLVHRHVDMIYSAAMRQAGGDRDLAEEITQRVFILLARKAPRLTDERVLLGGWLYNAVRLLARDAMRKRRRRAFHEQRAAQMASQRRDAAAAGKEDPWARAEDQLDEAMARLGKQSRGLLVLRFFEGKSAREVGEQLGISEEAARKRVSRALDELRDLFARRGVAMSATGLAQGLAVHGVLKAPEGLAASAASAATSAGASAAGIGTGAVIMAAAKTKIAAAMVIGALALGGGVAATVQVVHYFSPPRSRTVVIPPAKLEGPTISGIVRGPDGKPVAGATFDVGSATKQAYAYDGVPRRGAPAAPATDDTGKYIVAVPSTGTYALVVRAPQGYAEVSSAQLARGADVKLQPWGRIEGVVQSGGKIIPRAGVHLWRVGENDEPVHHETSTKADANGRFVFPRVPPGEVCVYRDLDNFRHVQWRYVIVDPGQTVAVQFGGAGQSVAGRIDVPPNMADLIAWTMRGKHTYEASVRLDPDPTDPVKHAPDEPIEQYWEKEIAFGRTPEGKLYKEWRFGNEFAINPDGSFRIDDLPPGKYRVSVRCFEEDAEVNFSEDIAKAEMKFEIPPASATQPSTGAAIEIGTATPTLISRIRPGAAAPDFTVTTIDGQTWKYADHRGKPLVLVFWGTFSNTDRIKAYGEFGKWGKDPRLSILGCFNARAVDEARKVIAENHLDFPHTSDLSLLSKFDSSWPEAVVVSADGKIMQKHLHDKVLEKYVKKALGITTAPSASSPPPAAVGSQSSR